jgi:hypothetical protein
VVARSFRKATDCTWRGCLKCLPQGFAAKGAGGKWYCSHSFLDVASCGIKERQQDVYWCEYPP